MKNTLLKPLAGLILASTFIGSTAFANEKTIRESLKQLTPNADAAEISPSVIPGLYQVTLGTRVLFMGDKGRYIFSGNLIDLKTRTNLTKSVENAQRKKVLDSLDESKMIVYPAQGKTKRTITVFSDIDCPYCHKLHNDIPRLTSAGIKVRYLAYPRAGVNSGSYKKAVSVWCSTNRRQALDTAMSGGQVPSKTCSNPVKQDMQLAQVFDVNGTPSIVIDDGEFVPGYVPAKDLIAKLIPTK